MDKIWSHVKAEFPFSPKQYNTIIYLTTLSSKSTVLVQNTNVGNKGKLNQTSFSTGLV